MKNTTRRAIDEQIAAMKQNEEAAGLWCVCGHSSPTHDGGFTCQQAGCDCLNFRPSSAVEPTPRPWAVKSQTSIIAGERGIATTHLHMGDWAEEIQRDEANGRLIVKAVNAHDGLVEALTELVEQVSIILNSMESGKDDDLESAYQFADAKLEELRQVSQ